jgi:segregation and condensation protein A
LSYLVHLKQFEGPLGLLLYLIRKEEMDILDINVTEITRQYLEYIRMMKELDLELAGEFVAMAATLIHIKSRLLLPQYNEEGEVVETEDPRKELVQKLLEYQRYQEAAKKLYDRPLLGRDVFIRGHREKHVEGEQVGDIIIDEDGLFSLISTYRRALRKATRKVHQVREKVQSIAARVMELKDRLLVGGRVLLRDLVNVGNAPRRAQLLVTFLSMLELGRMGYVTLFQAETYGDIHIDTIKPIERNVLERVQEFDSLDADKVVANIINEAIETQIDMEEMMADAPKPTEVDLDAAVADLANTINAEQNQLTFEEQLHELEQEQISDGMINAENFAVIGAEVDEDSDERFTGEEIATDEEIAAAERELAPGTTHEPEPGVDA